VDAPSFEIGLDEAGYGPLLGPLAVGAVRVDGPRGAFKRALTSRAQAMPKVADSKVLYAGKDLAALEVAALAARTLAGGGVRPKTVAEFLGFRPAGLDDHPWYGPLDAPLPRAAAPDRVDGAAEALDRALRRQGAALGSAQARVFLEGDLNARFARTGCKGAAHLEHVGDAFLAAYDGAPDLDGAVDCDRLGGRRDYEPFLRDLFPFRPIATLEEAERVSAYVVRPREREVRVRFVVEGEVASPLVALASCLAKYAREILMEAFNGYFASKAPGLTPTAGYWNDGPRFLDDLERLTGDGAWRTRLARTR